MNAALILAVVLVAANGFFVAAEFSIARLRPTQIADFIRDRRPGAKSAKHAVEHIDAYLSACQLGITLSSLGLGAVGEPAFHDLLEPVFGDETQIVGIGLAGLIAFSIITVAHVVLGELAPKSAAISRTAPVALALSPLMRAFYVATKPVVDLFNAMGNLVLKPFGVPPASEAGHAPHSEDEIRELLRGSQAGGLIGREERELSEAALTFGDFRARDVMQPRSGIDFVRDDEPVDEVIAKIRETGRTRLPLVPADSDLDDAEGVIHAKDLLGGADDLRASMRPLPRVAEGSRLDEVLRDMRGERRHLALVVEERGTVTGLITIEDVIEELVGEIDDEFDTEVERLVERDASQLAIDGTAPVRLVERALGTDFGDHHEGTIGGLVIEHLGRVPDAGETIDLAGSELVVEEADETQVLRLTAESVSS